MPRPAFGPSRADGFTFTQAGFAHFNRIGAVGTRETSYWLRGLGNRAHTVTVRVVIGTFTVDGVDALTQGQPPRT